MTKSLTLTCALLCLAISTTSCTIPSKHMDLWVGHSEKELLTKWGPPDRKVKYASGEKVYSWSSKERLKDGGGTCRKLIVLDTNNVVKQSSYQNCGGPPVSGLALVEPKETS